MGNKQAGGAHGGDDERENCDGEAPAAQEDEEAQEIRDEEEWGDEDELGGVEPVLAQLPPAAAARARPPPTAAASPEMPALLGEWGCDEELWVAIRSKEKLLRFARAGKEDSARLFIARVRKIVDGGDLA